MNPQQQGYPGFYPGYPLNSVTLQQMAAGYQGPPGFNPENCRSLYVGNLDQKVTEAILFDIFSIVGPVEGCKLIKDKSTGYGFVDYYDHQTAALALQTLNGRNIYGYEVKVNWAFAGSHREDTSSHYHIFVGDLSPEIDDRALFNAFSAFGTISSDARVMWDQNTGRSRGYGFVAFRSKEDAQRALTEMNGEWLGNRAIRCNWANQKTEQQNVDLSTVLNQTSPTNTTVYVGNLSMEVTDQMLRAIFGDFGAIEEIRVQRDKGFAFLRYTEHDSAAKAILGCHGKVIGQRAVKCSWGKERPTAAVAGPIGPQIPPGMPMPGLPPPREMVAYPPPPPYGYYQPQYGYQPNFYDPNQPY